MFHFLLLSRFQLRCFPDKQSKLLVVINLITVRIKVEKFMTRGYMKDSEFIENFNDYDEIVESKPFEGTDLEFKDLDENSVGRNVI